MRLALAPITDARQQQADCRLHCETDIESNEKNTKQKILEQYIKFVTSRGSAVHVGSNGRIYLDVACSQIDDRAMR